jgi:hypothetical protein
MRLHLTRRFLFVLRILLVFLVLALLFLIFLLHLLLNLCLCVLRLLHRSLQKGRLEVRPLTFGLHRGSKVRWDRRIRLRPISPGSSAPWMSSGGFWVLYEAIVVLSMKSNKLGILPTPFSLLFLIKSKKFKPESTGSCLLSFPYCF